MHKAQPLQLDARLRVHAADARLRVHAADARLRVHAADARLRVHAADERRWVYLWGRLVLPSFLEAVTKPKIGATWGHFFQHFFRIYLRKSFILRNLAA